MYNQNFCLDEIEATGNKIRIQNKMKAKNVMALAVNFVDDQTLAKVQQVLLNLDEKEVDALKTYLDKRQYMKPAFQNSLGNKIVNKISRIALFSTPEDEYLQKLYSEYKDNLEMIDGLKIQSAQTTDMEEATECIQMIHIYNERNIELIEKVNAYRDKKYNTA
ncbi:MAG: hypothetical protein AB1782_20280 [Cyanobacteriota bacterium]